MAIIHGEMGENYVSTIGVGGRYSDILALLAGVCHNLVQRGLDPQDIRKAVVNGINGDGMVDIEGGDK